MLTEVMKTKSDVADEQMPIEDLGEIDDVSEDACEIDLHDLMVYNSY